MREKELPFPSRSGTPAMHSIKITPVFFSKWKLDLVGNTKIGIKSAFRNTMQSSLHIYTLKKLDIISSINLCLYWSLMLFLDTHHICLEMNVIKEFLFFAIYQIQLIFFKEQFFYKKEILSIKWCPFFFCTYILNFMHI